MTEKTEAVRGPMYIDTTPLMVTADVEPLVHANVGQLLDLLVGEFFDDFMEIARPSEGSTPDEPQYASEQLQSRLVEYLATKVSLTGPEAMRVAGRMAKLGKPLADRSAETAAKVARGASLIKHPSHARTRKHLAENPLPEQQDRRSA
jgi:hypothetical protein